MAGGGDALKQPHTWHKAIEFSVKVHNMTQNTIRQRKKRLKTKEQASRQARFLAVISNQSGRIENVA
jgi:hypothetical protein